jgi:mRNA interferase RelE/StbE
MNGGYRLILQPRAQRDLDRFTGETLQQLCADINELAMSPRGQGTKKLRGSEGVYRKRSGSYRILYEIDDAAHEILIQRVAKRDDAY